MRIPLDTERDLVLSPLSGAIAVVNRDAWSKLGLKWLDRPFNPETDLPQSCTGWFHLRGLLPSPGRLPEDQWRQLDNCGFIMSRNHMAKWTMKLQEFQQRFNEERHHTFFVTPATQSNGCPLACVYCFEKNEESSFKQSRKLTDPGGVKAIVDFIAQYAHQHSLSPDKISVQLFGGEPFLPNLTAFWEELLQEVVVRGWCWAAVTSGATLNRDHFKLINRFKAHHLQEINITLDGVETTHNKLRPLRSGQGTFQSVTTNIDKLLTAGVPVLVKTNFGRDNYRNYRELLDYILETDWLRHDFVLMVNVIQPFGGTETEGQSISEAEIVAELIRIFREPKYAPLLPILRLEGKKLTGYIAAAFEMLSRPGEVSVFNEYPYLGFCNPGKGNSFNIGPDGSLRACNWMVTREGFSEANVFQDLPPARSRYALPLFNSDSRPCNTCDISTICGGGCAIDRQQLKNYYDGCRDNHLGIIRRFVATAVTEGWIKPDLAPGQLFRIVRESFNLEYRYHNRAIPEQRISQAGAAWS